MDSPTEMIEAARHLLAAEAHGDQALPRPAALARELPDREQFAVTAAAGAEEQADA